MRISAAEPTREAIESESGIDKWMTPERKVLASRPLVEMSRQ